VNFAVVGTVFAHIFVGELPDKTMVSSLVMSSRGRPFEVWLGAAGAFLVHVVIATTLGCGRVSPARTPGRPPGPAPGPLGRLPAP
jgi:putative Ca2+/H+ antiporter (TMEM165/GDT1 family)